MRGIPLDDAEIHRKIYSARDRNSKVRIYQKKFAEALGISTPHMSRVIKRFIEQGRIKKIGAGYRNVGTYYVKNPADFPDLNADLNKSGLSSGN